ncbi:LLM class flavin-dependent oxidoreductase [Nocardia anaemiae]|uniref:LLM class flavin-dependent oxidoreductase n=1 Tax=Nocardia anaemiae TaxID=263910 RepID=UPI0007C7DD29|nr:LLM class flavin-dependent oxidoreductase [Nocardia anaemiae]
MRYAISVPQLIPDGTFQPESLRAYLDRAEALGFESAWTTEQLLGSAPNLSPIELLTYAAACNERLRFGCAVFVTPLHNPVHLAKRISTLDQLTRGRLEIGVGIGGRNRMFSAFDVDPADNLVSRFNEGLRVMKALWTQPRTDFEGEFWQLTAATMEPKPFQKPYPPLWFGGSTPAALRRAVRHGNGFFGAGSTTTAKFAEQVRFVRETVAENPGAPSDFRIAKRVYIAVDDDPARAEQRMATALTDFYGDFGKTLLPVAVHGTPKDCIQGLREVADVGAELILINPLFDEYAQMERIATEVLPHLP